MALHILAQSHHGLLYQARAIRPASTSNGMTTLVAHVESVVRLRGWKTLGPPECLSYHPTTFQPHDGIWTGSPASSTSDAAPDRRSSSFESRLSKSGGRCWSYDISKDILRICPEGTSSRITPINIASSGGCRSFQFLNLVDLR